MLPYTPLHHLLAVAVRRALRADQRQRVRRADRLRRRRCVRAPRRRSPTTFSPTIVRSTPAPTIPSRASSAAASCRSGARAAARRSRWRCRGARTGPSSPAARELKNTFCLAKDAHAFRLAPHRRPGELPDAAGVSRGHRALPAPLRRRRRGSSPTTCTRSTCRPSSRSQLPGVELVGVQHHHAHVAACLAENGVEGPAIGVAFDGLGYGLDGTLWGGEFLVADLAGFERVGHFEPVPMPGGTTAIRQPWRMAAAYLDAAYGGTSPARASPSSSATAEHWSQVVALARTQLNAPLTSSVGRLFDAVARDRRRARRDRATRDRRRSSSSSCADRSERGAYPRRIGSRRCPTACAAPTWSAPWSTTCAPAPRAR